MTAPAAAWAAGGGLLRWQWLVTRVFLGLGIALAAAYWYLLTRDGGAPVDALAYWAADPSNLYVNPALHNGYNYSPAWELLIGWGRLLPFTVFVAIFRAVILGTLVWLAGPLTVFVLFLPPVASEVNAGNIQFLLAAAIVLSFRKGAGWGGTWAFVLLTKVTPGVGLLWFALRREWQKLAWAFGVTGAIVILTAAIWPDRWFAWFGLLSAGTSTEVAPYYWSIWLRLPFAIAFVVLGAWRGWRWPVVVAGTLALPVFFFLSPSMLVGVLPFLRAAAGRWVARRSAAPAYAADGHARDGAAATEVPPPAPAGT